MGLLKDLETSRENNYRFFSKLAAHYVKRNLAMGAGYDHGFTSDLLHGLEAVHQQYMLEGQLKTIIIGAHYDLVITRKKELDQIISLARKTHDIDKKRALLVGALALENEIRDLVGE